MNETIYAMAAALTTPAEEECAVLELLCQAEEKRLTHLLGDRAEEWQEAFLCAAAFFAAAALLESRGADKVESFTVGDVSVKGGGSGAKGLRQQAERLLAVCGFSGEAFSFRGVWG